MKIESLTDVHSIGSRCIFLGASFSVLSAATAPQNPYHFLTDPTLLVETAQTSRVAFPLCSDLQQSITQIALP